MPKERERSVGREEALAGKGKKGGEREEKKSTHRNSVVTTLFCHNVTAFYFPFTFPLSP